MIKIEHTDVYGFESAVRGMRNPMNSWDKIDSFMCREDGSYDDCEKCPKHYNGCVYIYDCGDYFILGDNDLKLMKNLSKAGDDHGKFLRMINVTVDITAPLYWWKEFDTYKVGTVANSCSTMHKIHDKEFTLDDFSHEHIDDTNMLWMIPNELNKWRNLYLETKDKLYWWQMIQLLPSSYNQKRTVQLNYQVLKSMYFARRQHKLDEWHDFCYWCESLPYFKEICIQE